MPDKDTILDYLYVATILLQIVTHTSCDNEHGAQFCHLSGRYDLVHTTGFCSHQKVQTGYGTMVI